MFEFTGHATEQMFARKISIDDVKTVIQNGQRIASYPDDRPYPSYLMFSYINQRPIHVVVAVNSEADTCIVVTAYEPSLDIWKKDFRSRK
ncbi:protein of unknown function (DUF4258) [Fodinibius salinus]|uniref:DUF4258 domain-containing protein n=1 Tax=Fodinibius salinus TaxID=860790 RepID=A0A5D3YRK6_9BACT|nr:DUF4258 domain-containing protein [Fodinibius salinus]TYP95633.1 protein of unknown function (DUF4258) [Fodinibius salinus]